MIINCFLSVGAVFLLICSGMACSDGTKGGPAQVPRSPGESSGKQDPSPAKTPSAESMVKRPALEARTGRYYRYSIPTGWSVNENQNGIELAAPDGKTGVGFSFVGGAFGQVTPRQYIEGVTRQLGLTDAEIVSTKQHPDEPAFMNYVWKVIEAGMTFTYQGTPTRCVAFCGVVQGSGQYVAALRFFQAPQARWDEEKYWLPRVAESIVLVDASSLVAQQQVILPKGISHDYIYGSYNKGWQERGLPMDRISKGQREGMMGYERVKDPATGQIYELPLEAYDKTMGGYRNPRRPTEILTPTQPGE